MLKHWTSYTNVPPPGPSAYDHLVHVIELYDGPAEDFAVTGSYNIYGPDQRTGLTWHDLIEIKRQMEKLMGGEQ